MKIRFLMTGLLGLISATTFAQKGTLSDAQAEYTKYETLRGNKAMAKLAGESLSNSKTLIDKAAANEKTSGLPLTFAVKGAVYSSLALADTVVSSSAPLFDTADESLKKAKELDTKGENKVMVDNAYRNLAQYQLNKGAKAFDKKDYSSAYKAFDYFRSVLPEDTTAIYYTAIAADNAKNYPAAITNYTKLLTTGYSAKAKLYSQISYLYLDSKDTANAVKILDEGATKFPNDAALSKRSIELSLQMGKQKEVLAKIDGAIKNDPKNKTLYYYASLTYSQEGDNLSKDAAKAKDPAVKAKLVQAKLDNYAKAEAMDRKALEIDPDYFEANLNLGYVLLSPAIEVYNAAINIPLSKTKEYNDAIKKSSDLFDQSKPYLLKAVDLKPTSYEALYNLKTYYVGKKDNANVTVIQKRIDALK